MKTKFTPGPWKVFHRGETAIFVGKQFSQGEAEVCSVEFTAFRSEQNANARLIAAAPEMLEAIQDCLPDLKHYVATHGPGPDRRLATLCAAIAKATGE